MADITKANEQIAAWDKNLEKLKNGEFGAYKMPGEAEKALLRYWRAQAEAGYPCANENVRYYRQIVKLQEVGKQFESERNEISEIIAQTFLLNGAPFDASDFEWSAHSLQMAGYRKASDVAREIFEEIENLIDKKFSINHGFVLVSKEDFAELKKKYTESE